MRLRTIQGSPQRSASAAWDELERMVAETLAPASAIDGTEVDQALAAVRGIGPVLVAVGVLSDQPVVLRALPLQLEITVALGAAAGGEERLGKVPGAAAAQEWTLHLPDPEPYAADVRTAVDGHSALRAGAAPIEAEQSSVAAVSGFAIDEAALRRLSGGSS